MISKFQFFSTPFSKEYKNVIDKLPLSMGSTDKGFLRYLQSNQQLFPQSSVFDVGTDENTNFRLKVYEETQEGMKIKINFPLGNEYIRNVFINNTVLKYNYIAMLKYSSYGNNEIDSKVTFYFIDNQKIISEKNKVKEIIDEDSGTIYKNYLCDGLTLELYLIRDVWHSNLKEYREKLENVKSNVIRCHDTYTSLFNTLTEKYPFLDSNRTENKVKHCGKVLFAKLVLNINNNNVENVQTSDGIVLPLRYFQRPSDSLAYVIYVPVGYLVEDTDIVYGISYNRIYLHGGQRTSTSPTTIQNFLDKIKSHIGGDLEIIECTLTYNTPIQNYFNNKITVNPTYRVIEIDDRSIDSYSLPRGHITDIFGEEYVYENYLYPYYVERNGDVNITKIYSDIYYLNDNTFPEKNYDINTFDDVNIVNNKNIILSNENNRHKICINEKVIEITFNCTNIIINYKYRMSSNPSIDIYVDNDKLLVSNMYISSGYAISYNKDSYAEYRQLNGNFEETQLLTSQIVNVIINATMTAALSAVNPVAGGLQVIKTGADQANFVIKRRELEHKFNVLMQENNFTPSVSGFYSLLDIVYIYTNKLIVTSDYKNKIKEITKYGYDVNIYDSPIHDYRELYDFKQISGDIPIDIPSYDKGIITEMFNNGVTLWHLDLHNDAGNYIGNYQCTNNERS